MRTLTFIGVLVLTMAGILPSGGLRSASAQESDAAADSPSLGSMDASDSMELERMIKESGQNERTRRLIREGLASDNLSAIKRALVLSNGSDEFQPDLVNLYKRTYDYVKFQCMDAIEQGGSEIKGARFRELLECEQNPSNRAALYRRIAKSDASQLDFLIEKMGSPGTSQEERCFIIDGLAHYPTTRTVEILLDQWHDAQDEEIRSAALGSLGMLSAYRMSHRRDAMVKDFAADGRPSKIRFNTIRDAFVYHDVPAAQEIDEEVCEILENVFLGAYGNASERVKKQILIISLIITTHKSIALLQSVAADESAGALQVFARDQLAGLSL